MVKIEDISPFLNLALLKGESTIHIKEVEQQLWDTMDDTLMTVIEKESVHATNEMKTTFIPFSTDIVPSSTDTILEKLKIRGGWYSIRSLPSWLNMDQHTQDNMPKDDWEAVHQTNNFLVIFAYYKHYLGIIATQEKLRSHLFQMALKGTEENKKIESGLQLLEMEEFERFVQGPAINFWLDGIHKTTTMKADKKALFGKNLRHALDTIADQTYFYSSVVSEPPMLENISKRVGVNYGKKTIWLGQSTSYSEFHRKLTGIFKFLCKENDVDSFPGLFEQEKLQPMPVLSKQLPVSELAKADEPFEIILEPLMPFRTGVFDNENSQFLKDEEVWDECGYLEICSEQDYIKYNVPKEKILAEAYFNKKLLCVINFQLSVRGDNIIQVNYEIVNYLGLDKNSEGMIYLDRMLVKVNDRIKIYYESGHVFKDGRLFSMRYREFVFHDIEWMNLDGFTIDKEKPLYVKNISQCTLADFDKDDSLFSYVIRKLPRFFKTTDWVIACDDGSNEIADLIMLDKSSLKIYLIHVKASTSKKVNRKISLGAFEVLIAQTMKNLYAVSSDFFLKTLQDRSTVNESFVWSSDGKILDRKTFIALMEKVAQKCTYNMVILQPQLTKKRWPEIEKDPSKATRRVKQLSTILEDLKNRCNNMDANLFVLAEKS